MNFHPLHKYTKTTVHYTLYAWSMYGIYGTCSPLGITGQVEVLLNQEG